MADLNEWTYAAGYGELMAAMHFAAFLNSHRKEREGPAPVPFPWTPTKPQEQVSAAEREHLREQLKRRSAFQH